MTDDTMANAPTTSASIDEAGSLGVILPRDLPADQVIEYARTAEALGFDELWVVEDLGFRGGIAQAAVVLASTSSISVGIGILPVAVRDVVFEAMELTTLAEIFPGRVVVGLGHGTTSWLEQIGARPASPLTLFDEHTTALRSLLRGERVTVAGRYVTVTDVALERVAQVQPPIVAGVRGPKSIALAGRITDGVVLAEPVTPEYIAGALEALGPGSHHVVAYNVAAVDDDGEIAVETVRPGLEWVGEADWAPHIRPLAFADEFRALRDESASRLDFVRAMPSSWVRALAVVGTPAEARSRVDELVQAGATSVVLLPIGQEPLVALRALGRIVDAR